MQYFATYKEIKKRQPIRFRGHIRNLALNGLSIIDKITGIQKDLSKPRIQFLYIHHAFKDEEKMLDVLLKKLSLNHTFISYSDAVTKILNRKIDNPYISISLDDGFKNNIRAAEIMNNNGAKGCFFINPSIVGEKSFETITNHCKERLNFPPVEFLNWQNVEQLQKMGHEIGSHTMAHINVAKTSKEYFIEDCNKTFEIIKSRCGEAKHFAFPYGRFFDFNEFGRKTVFECGFISCASAERGCHINPDKNLLNEELCILRDHVILDWNINHVFHYLAHNSRNAITQNNLFPYK